MRAGKPEFHIGALDAEVQPSMRARHAREITGVVADARVTILAAPCSLSWRSPRTRELKIPSGCACRRARLGSYVRRQPTLHGGWLYGYVEPVVRWNRNFRWHPDIGVRVGLD